MRRRNGAREFLDGPLDVPLLHGNLRDLERVNRWLGGEQISWAALEAALREQPRQARIRLLDIGTGAGDIPRGLLRRASLAGLSLDIVATDIRPEIVDFARAGGLSPGLTFQLADPDRIDAPDRSFDVVHSSMLLHHQEPPRAVRMMREMARVARLAVVVNDLDRGDHWFLLAKVLAVLLSTNRYTRNDGPLSVARAYRPNEVAQIAARAGLVPVARHWTWPAYRYALVFGHQRGAHE